MKKRIIEKWIFKNLDLKGFFVMQKVNGVKKIDIAFMKILCKC